MLQHPSAGVRDAENRQQNDTELLDDFAVDVLFATLVLCLLIAVTCTWGIHQHSGRETDLYSLLLTVNNELMCKADFCGCVVPHPRLLLTIRRLHCCI